MYLPPTISQNGLSPLARGTRADHVVEHIRWRFIPAGAGNTEINTDGGVSLPVYPRWRGEHGLAGLSALFSNGLSPLARGTRRNEVRYSFRVPVYPRWRGEHIPFHSSSPIMAGLSPLARGTPIAATLEANPGRFIPAGAGNTPRS